MLWNLGVAPNRSLLWGLPKRKQSYSNHPFSGAFAVSFREGNPTESNVNQRVSFNGGVSPPPNISVSTGSPGSTTTSTHLMDSRYDWRYGVGVSAFGFGEQRVRYTTLVVSTHLKNISQIGNLPQVGVKIKIIETTTWYTTLMITKKNTWDVPSGKLT